jgi:hypothetical protein
VIETLVDPTDAASRVTVLGLEPALFDKDEASELKPRSGRAVAAGPAAFSQNSVSRRQRGDSTATRRHLTERG